MAYLQTFFHRLLYCPKCKQKTLINVKDLQITVIQKQEH